MLWMVTCESPEEGKIGRFYVESEEYPNPTEGMLIVGEVRMLASLWFDGVSVRFDSALPFKAWPTAKYWVEEAQSELISESEYEKMLEERDC